MPEQITLYTAKVCPYAHRTELALEEAKADYTKFQIDLSNKPEWYALKVNPASKVPAIAYGGPKTLPEDPSPESAKLAESLVLIEFIADLFPDSDLLPKDPVERAKVRFFIDAVSTKVIPAISPYVARGGPIEPVLEAYDFLQQQIQGPGKYALGDRFTLADIAIAPFLGRSLLVSLKNGIGKFDKEYGKQIWAALNEPKYDKFWQYFNNIQARSSWKDTFDEEYFVQAYANRFNAD